jgi:superfamily II DNA or RNA helicase
MELYKHQIEFLKSNPNKSALVWSCGTGKTRTALEWASVDSGITLIVCPKALKTNWCREADKWASNHKVHVVTKEEFRRDSKSMMAYDQIIIDEVHNGFLTPNFKSQMSKALRDYIKKHQVPRILLLSATVYTSSPWNIYQLATFLGHKWNWKSFSYTFFDQIRMGMRVIPQAKKGVEKKLAELTKKIASVVNIYDVLDVPLQQHCEPEYFALTKEQKKAIEENYDPLPIVRYTQQHEIENGILLANEFRELKTYETDKEERIKTICEENKKVAIVCRYNAQIDYIRTSFTNERKPIFIIRGDVKDRDKVTQKAETSEECIVLIQADCAEGYELPSFPICIFASMSYSYTKWEQICGRFLRMNKPSRTTFIYLLTEGESVDQGIYDAVKRKEDFKIELFKK